jgi:hypothetical protein
VVAKSTTKHPPTELVTSIDPELITDSIQKQFSMGVAFWKVARESVTVAPKDVTLMKPNSKLSIVTYVDASVTVQRLRMSRMENFKFVSTKLSFYGPSMCPVRIGFALLSGDVIVTFLEMVIDSAYWP